MNKRSNDVVTLRWPLMALCLGMLGTSCGDSSAEAHTEPAMVEQEGRADRFELDRAGLANLDLETARVETRTLVGARSYPGLVSYKQTTRAALVSQVEGVVQSVAVSLGQTVKAGDVVCVINSRGLAQARSRFLEAMHKAKFAGTLFKTESELWEKQITSRESFLRAQHEFGDTKLALDSAKHELLSLGLSEQDVQAMHAEGDAHLQDDAHMEGDSLLDLALLSFTSPIDGQVVLVGASQGEAVGPGQELLDVADLSQVWVNTQVPVGDLAKMKVGNGVTVHWEAGDLSARGTIAYLAPEIDATSQTGLARIELNNEAGHWRPGLYVDVSAEVNPESVALAVPTTALVADPESPSQFFVFVQLAEGRFEARPVVVQRSEDGFSAVSGRLKVGDLVVSSDTIFLKAVWMGEGGMEE